MLILRRIRQLAEAVEKVQNELSKKRLANDPYRISQDLAAQWPPAQPMETAPRDREIQCYTALHGWRVYQWFDHTTMPPLDAGWHCLTEHVLVNHCDCSPMIAWREQPPIPEVVNA